MWGGRERATGMGDPLGSHQMLALPAYPSCLLGTLAFCIHLEPPAKAVATLTGGTCPWLPWLESDPEHSSALVSLDVVLISNQIGTMAS